MFGSTPAMPPPPDQLSRLEAKVDALTSQNRTLMILLVVVLVLALVSIVV
jgi:hypothetical protein